MISLSSLLKCFLELNFPPAEVESLSYLPYIVFENMMSSSACQDTLPVQCLQNGVFHHLLHCLKFSGSHPFRNKTDVSLDMII